MCFHFYSTGLGEPYAFFTRLETVDLSSEFPFHTVVGVILQKRTQTRKWSIPYEETEIAKWLDEEINNGTNFEKHLTIKWLSFCVKKMSLRESTSRVQEHDSWVYHVFEVFVAVAFVELFFVVERFIKLPIHPSPWAIENTKNTRTRVAQCMEQLCIWEKNCPIKSTSGEHKNAYKKSIYSYWE